MKSTVKKNHWQGKEPKPEMAAHPGFCAADAPRGNAFSRAEECGENHEGETNDPKREADNAAAARTLRCFEYRGHTRMQKAQRLPAMREPSRVGFYPFSFSRALAEHLGEKCARVESMRGVVRAGVNAAWFFQVRAKIARRRFLLDGRLLAPGSLRIVDQHFKWMQIDIAVGTILRG